VGASVPHDVDLEDHLVYGLTPVRFGYLVVAVLGAMSLSGLGWLPLAARLVLCFVLVMAAVVLAWGRWNGRPLDRLLVDMVVFLRRNYRVLPGLRLLRKSVSRSSAEQPNQMPRVSFAAINALGRRRSAPCREEVV
jgi:PrgI family protein